MPLEQSRVCALERHDRNLMGKILSGHQGRRNERFLRCRGEDATTSRRGQEVEK
jgi:hypothetical protein